VFCGWCGFLIDEDGSSARFECGTADVLRIAICLIDEDGSSARFECGTAGCTLFETLLLGFIKRRGLEI